MKTITAILIFLSSNIISQNGWNAYLISANKNTICINDTVVFKVHIDSLLLINFPSHQIELYDSSSTCCSFVSNGWTLKQIADSNYTYKIWLVGVNQGLRRYYSAQDNYNNPAINVFVNNCYAGIETHNNKEDLISTEYFNLLGQPISEPNSVTVEVKTFRGGYREVRKIVN